MDYISEIPTEEASWDLVTEFNTIKQELRQIFPYEARNRDTWRLESPKREFIETIDLLEKLFFMNHTIECKNKIIGNSFTYLKNEIQSQTAPIGFVLTIAPKTHYQELTEAKHLEVFEKELKNYPAQFIKIFTIKNILYVYMNKQPTWEQLLKIKIMQWTLFNKQIKTPEPNIMKFLSAMLNKELIEVNNALTDIMNRSDFNELKYNELIKVFEYGSKRNVRKIENEIEALNDNISAYENALNKALVELNHYNQILSITKNQPKENIQPLIKYFTKHPYIKSAKPINEYTIEMYFEAPLIYYDKYILEKIINNKTGTSEKILKIFENNEYELITRCKIQFNTENFKVSLRRVGNSSIIGHPHIDRFNCFGNHNKAIQESAAVGDHLGAIEQISQSVLNLNFSDTYVIDTLLTTLKENPNKYKTWRHKETGTMLTTMEVLEQNEKIETN